LSYTVLTALRSAARARTFQPICVAAILAAALGLRLVQLALTIHESLAPVSVPIPSQARAPPRRESDDLQCVLAAHLFGSGAADPSAAHTPAFAGWVLSGVMAGATAGSGWAILGENAQSTQVRFVSQEVAPGYRLTQVLEDRVAIDGHGARLILRLPRARVVSASEPGDAGEGTLAAAAVPAGVWHPPKGLIGVPLPAQLVLLTHGHRDSDGEYNGLQVMGADARLSPLGLQRTDVITAIDGHAITSANDGQQALQQLSGGSTVMVTVERNGSPLQLPLTISENGG
jgi:type II secretory pathway component PulC